jgi:hypothetical protein
VAILVVLGALLVQVLLEGWVVTRFGDRSTDADGLTTVDPAEWPKTIKSGLYFLLLALTAVKLSIDRAWRTLTTRADIALLALGAIMAVAGLVGGSSSVLIGQALFVYFRGVIVFYAFRALRPTWNEVKPFLWIGGSVIAVSSLIGVVQFWVGESAYTSLGWVDLKWPGENRAHGLFDHPNDLGHLAGLMTLGLVAWFVTTEKRIGKRWWALFALTGLAVAVAQSRQSILGVLCALALIALLRRTQWKRLIAAGLLFVLLSALPLMLSRENRENLAYRWGGVFNALLLWDGSQQAGGRGPQAEGNDAEVRVLYLKQGVKLFEENPALGYGVGQFGGIVAVKADSEWNKDPRFIEVLGPNGFHMYEFVAVSVDLFWLHLLIEVGAVGLLAYLAWMWFVGSPLLRAAWRRGPPAEANAINDRVYVWAVAALAFALLNAAWSPVLEDPFFPPLLFAVLGFGWVLWQRERLKPVEETLKEG